MMTRNIAEYAMTCNVDAVDMLKALQTDSSARKQFETWKGRKESSPSPMPILFNSSGSQKVSFTFNGGNANQIVAFHYINCEDRHYGAQMVESKHFKTQGGAVRWGKKVLA